MTLLGFIIPLIIGLSGMTVFIYLALYKRHINKKISNMDYNQGGYEETIVKKMPDSHDAFTTIAVVVLIFSIITMSNNIRNLENDIDSLREHNQNMAGEIEELDDKITIIQKSLAESKSVFENVEVSFGKLESSTNEAQVTFTFTPKENIEGSKYYMSIAKQNVELKENGKGEFSGTVKLDIFKKYSKLVCTIEEPDGKTKNEKIRAMPKWDEKLLSVLEYDDSFGEEEYDVYTDSMALKYLHYISSEDVDDSTKVNNDTANINIVGCVDADSPLAVMDNALVSSKVIVKYESRSGTEVVDEKDIDISGYEDEGKIEYSYKKKMEIKMGDRIALYVEATDSYGYKYEVPVISYESDGPVYDDCDADIIDLQGNIQYY
ncbi:MAG: hypothetical protein E7254_07080 [Lachnospiraceae bacterium]|nr:hypothetical protein [Lachnospiraceae bacterium]